MKRMIKKRGAWHDARLGALGESRSVRTFMAKAAGDHSGVVLYEHGDNSQSRLTCTRSSDVKWVMEEVIRIARRDCNGRERYMLEHLCGDHRLVRREEMKKIAGSAITQWCFERPGKYLHHDLAFRVGLYEQEKSAEEWGVDTVMFIPHSTVLRTSVGVQRVVGPRYYGRNHDEPRYGWHEVNLYTLSGVGLVNVLAHQGIWNGGIPFSTEHDYLMDSTTIHPTNCVDAVECLDYYCVRNPFVPIRVSSCGARPVTEESKRFALKEERMEICRTRELCLQASLVNGIARAIGHEYAREVMLNGTIPVMISFTSASRWINNNAKRVALNRVCISKERSVDRIGWLLGQTDAVFLVRLRGKNVDHVVCVDAKLRQILDAVEQYPLQLSEESLRCCLGDTNNFEKVLEIRMIVERMVSHRKSRNGSSKRMRKRARS